MKCQFCETENPENAVFCKHCGRRVDGNGLCPHCGRLTPADGEFCIHCGCNRNAPVIAYPHPELLPSAKKKEAKTEALSTIAAAKPAYSAVKEPEAAPKAKNGLLNRILNLVSFGAGCAVLLFCLIFFFLIGADGKAGDLTGESLYIYHFFGDAWTGLESFSECPTSYGIIGPLLGLLCVIAPLIGFIIALGFAIKEIVVVAKAGIRGSITKYAAVAYFLYLSGVVLFMLNVTVSVEMAGERVGISLNGASIAGIVLGAIFLIASIVLDAISHGIVGEKKTYISQTVFGGVLALLAILVLSFVPSGIMGVSSGNVSSHFGITLYSQNLYALAQSYWSSSDDVWYDFFLNYSGSIAIMVVVAVLAILCVLFVALLLKDVLGGYGYGIKGGKTTRWGIGAGICAMLIGVCELILPLAFGSFIFGEDVEYSFAAPILNLVFGVLLFAGSIAAGIVLRERKPQDETQAA